MDKQTFISDLMALGFTEYEAKVYIALLGSYPNTGYQLSKQADEEAVRRRAAVSLHSCRRESTGFAEAALKLVEYRKLDPGPLEEWIFYDHPSGRARISMAMRWKAEHLAEPLADVAASPGEPSP